VLEFPLRLPELPGGSADPAATMGATGAGPVAGP